MAATGVRAAVAGLLSIDAGGDRLRQAQARLLQRFALVLLAAAALSIPTSLAAHSPVERAAGVGTGVALLALLAGALRVVRRGAVLQAGLLIVVSCALSAAVNMATTGIEGSRAVFVLLVFPIVLAGLLGDRRLLLAALAISALVPAAVLAGESLAPDLVGAQPDTYDPRLTILTFALCAGALALLVGYFGSALRAALADSLSRERELEGLRATLERQVAERTGQLSAALDEVRARSEEQAALLESLERQRTTIRELSIPVLPLTADTMVVPLVGGLDSERIEDLRQRALGAVGQRRARLLVIDVTGVPVVDTHVAAGIVAVARAARLLGAGVVLVGVRPEVAQTVVALGIDLGDIRTAPDMASVLAGLRA